MKLLVKSLPLDLVGTNRNLQIPNSSGKINTALGLNVNMSTQRRAEFQLRLAVRQLRGLLLSPGLRTDAAGQGTGDGIGEDAAGGVAAAGFGGRLGAVA